MSYAISTGNFVLRRFPPIFGAFRKEVQIENELSIQLILPAIIVFGRGC